MPGPTLLRKIKLAVVGKNDHIFLYNQFVLGLEDNNLVTKWSQEVRDWEVDHTKPNPFEASFKSALIINFLELLIHTLSSHYPGFCETPASA
jgi:hypothetical protein